MKTTYQDSARFEDQNLTLPNFYGHILVKCPIVEKGPIYLQT